MAELYNFVESTGIIVTDTADLKADVEAEYQEALGADLVLDDETPQGRLISAEVQARSAALVNAAQVANSMNPNVAGGVFLKSICAWFGIKDIGATRTTVPGVGVTGIPLTVIPAGSQAATENGDLFETVSQVILDSSGNGTVDFIALETGPVVAPAGYLNSVQTTVYGWETVSNPTAGVVGRLALSDDALRLQRDRRLGTLGLSGNESIISHLYGIEGVHSLAYLENISHETQVIDGVTMVPHSVWACVRGGTNADIAQALLYKTIGAGYNGDEVVSITEEISGVTYDVKFQRPTDVALQVAVTIDRRKAAASPSAVIPSVILDYADGSVETEEGFSVGVGVSPFELSGAISIRYPDFFVRSVTLARKGEALSTGVVDMEKWEFPTISEEDITIIEV